MRDPGGVGWRNFPAGLNKMAAIRAVMGMVSPYAREIPEGFALSIYE